MEQKSVFTSMTLWGLLGVLPGVITPFTIWASLDSTQQGLAVSAAIGWAFALWGRLRASKGLTLTGAPPAAVLFLFCVLGLSSCRSFPSAQFSISGFGVNFGVDTRPVTNIIGDAVTTIGGAVTGVGVAAATAAPATKVEGK